MLSPQLSYQVAHIGHEKQPILVIDNFVADAKGLLDYAMLQHDVLPAAGHYPGLRSAAPKAYEQMLSQSLANLLCSVFKVEPQQLSSTNSYYSMVSTPLNELTVVQQLPHFDQPKPNELACIHYLCDASHGGTSFYRHRNSGFEFIDESRSDKYLANLEKEIQQYGMPVKPCYINGENVFFERVTSVAAKFNRAVFYRCSSLHSGDISADYQFDMNPMTGRFTIASFIHS